MATESLTPEVLWAQRSSISEAAKNFIYLTISVPDVPKDKIKLDLKPQGLTFTGYSDTLKKTYHLELEFYDEINTEESSVHHTPKNIEMKLQKKELKEEYWPRLLKDAKKVHFLKTDFDKWVDEDEQNEAADDDFANFGGMGNDFGNIDFSKLGGGGDAPPMDDEEEDDEDEDEEMPPLEGEDEDEKKDADADKKE